jgi:hypothetical protein
MQMGSVLNAGLRPLVMFAHLLKRQERLSA